MTGDASRAPTRRRLLSALVASLVASGLAGCADGDSTGSDGSSGGASLDGDGLGRPEESHDWESIAATAETDVFDLPDEAPTSFGFARVGSELTLSYGSSGTDVEPIDAGTLYVLLSVDGRVAEVVVWETPIEGGDEVVVAPDGDLAMDAQSVTKLTLAWEYRGEVYVVQQFDEIL